MPNPQNPTPHSTLTASDPPYAPPELPGIAADVLNRALVDKMMQDGFAMVSSTVLRGRTTLRMCTLNPRATEADVDETIARLNRFASQSAY